MERPVSELTRYAVRQFLAARNEELGRLVEAAAKSDGISVNGQTRLDLDRLVWIIPDSPNGVP